MNEDIYTQIARLRSHRTMSHFATASDYKIHGEGYREAISDMAELARQELRLAAPSVASGAQGEPVGLSGDECHKILKAMALDADDWAEGLSYDPTEQEISKRCVEFIMAKVLANSAPNKALVAALQDAVSTLQSIQGDRFDVDMDAVSMAIDSGCAALKAAGVEGV